VCPCRGRSEGGYVWVEIGESESFGRCMTDEPLGRRVTIDELEDTDFNDEYDSFRGGKGGVGFVEEVPGALSKVMRGVPTFPEGARGVVARSG
jgi:hypothetical protein